MTRRERLYQIFEKVDEKKKELITETIENVIFLESQLSELRKVPHIKTHPQNKNLQKRTEAGKLYKECLQQYTNCIKLLCSTLNKDLVEEDDEFALWIKKKKGE